MPYPISIAGSPRAAKAYIAVSHIQTDHQSKVTAGSSHICRQQDAPQLHPLCRVATSSKPAHRAASSAAAARPEHASTAAAEALVLPALWSVGGAAAGATPNANAGLVPGTEALLAGTGAGASPAARAQLSFRCRSCRRVASRTSACCDQLHIAPPSAAIGCWRTRGSHGRRAEPRSSGQPWSQLRRQPRRQPWCCIRRQQRRRRKTGRQVSQRRGYLHTLRSCGLA